MLCKLEEKQKELNDLQEDSRKNEGMEPKQKEYPAVDVTGDRSKVRCCKEQSTFRTSQFTITFSSWQVDDLV